MKKFSLIILMCSFLFNCHRKDTYNLTQFYNKYKSESDFSMKVPGFLTRIAIQDEKADNWLKKLKSAKILLIEKENARHIGNIRYDLMKALQGEKLDELLSVNSQEDFISIQVLENNDAIKKLIIGVDSTDEFVLIDAKINATFEDISEIISEVKKDGKNAKSLEALY